MNVALIPVRGGSKSIPLKNIKSFCGRPLVYWVVKAAQESKAIDKVYVTTDCERIRRVVEGFQMSKVIVIGRSVESAVDTATTEEVMLEFADRYEFDNLVLIQATSPLLSSKDLDKGMRLFLQEGVDSVLSTVRQKRFCWQQEGEYVKPANYDYNNRPRRQEFGGYLVENGAFYIIGRKLLMKSKCRLAGNILAVEMPEETYYEIDEPSDWTIMEQLMQNKATKQYSDRISRISMVLTDSDGCLTDGGMYYSEKGDELKKFNTRDGVGFAMLKQQGILTGIVTGENVELVKRRAEKMQLDICECGINDKLACIQELCAKYDIPLANVAYLGDDINDLRVIDAVGFGCCVQDAVDKVKAKAKYITTCKGGDGAVREIAEMICNSKLEIE